MNVPNTSPDAPPDSPDEDMPDQPTETAPEIESGNESGIESGADIDPSIDPGIDPSIDPGHLRLLEAILFASTEPLSERALAYRLPEGIEAGPLLSALRDHYADRGITLVRAGKSWAFRTAPDLTQQLNKEIDVPRKLSRAAIETLAIIAYHQPVTRAEIEEVRGVGLSKGTLDVLLEANWIKPKGRRRTPGRPMTWGTTDGFLDHFGIEDVRDLPGMDELKAAGLLDSGPAISVYAAAAKKAGKGGGGDGAQLELIEDSNGVANEDTLGEEPEDAAEPLDPDDGESGRA